MEEKKLVQKQQTATIKLLDFIISGAVFLVFFLCPLFFTGLVAQNIGFEKMILFYFLILLGIVAWVTKGVITGELSFKRTPLDWPIVSFLGIFVISTIFSTNIKDSLIGSYGSSPRSLIAIISYILFYYLVVNNINFKKIKIFFWSLIGSTTLLAIYSLLQLLGIFILPLDFTNTVNFNPIGSLSSLTMYLVVALPILVMGMAQVREIHPALENKAIILFIKILLGAAGLTSLFILALLNGFTFWPAAIVGIVIVLMFLLSKIIKISNADLIIPITAFLLLMALLVLGNFNIMTLNLPVEVSLSREASWNIAKANLIKDPFLGSGPSTFYYSFAKFKGADFNNSTLWNLRFDNASGVLFELMANVGSLGVLAFVVIVLIALSICFLSLIKARQDETMSILLSLFSSFICIIIFAFAFTLNNSLVLIFVAISILTFSTAIVVYPEKFKTVNLSFRASPKYALALAAIFLTVSAGVVVLFTMGVKMYVADIYARQSLLSSDLTQKINKINKAIQLAPYQDSYYVNSANNYMALANQEASGGQNQATIENAISLAIERGKKATEIAPNKVSNYEALALIYENASFYVRGALEWSENLYNKIIELEPDSPTPYIRLALINMARANAETDEAEKEYYVNEAIKKYDEAIGKKGDLGAAYYGKAVAYEGLGNNNEAIEQLKKAVILNRDNVDYRFELGRLYFNRGVTQLSLNQTASEDITKGESEDDDLSVEPSRDTGAVTSKNDDLEVAEQIFLDIVQTYPNHVNALYSLAMVYQKTGETDNAKIVVKSLLDILTDENSINAIKTQFPGLY